MLVHIFLQHQTTVMSILEMTLDLVPPLEDLIIYHPLVKKHSFAVNCV